MKKGLLVLICIPLIELAVVLLSGKYIGVGWTILLIALTGILGAYLLKKQGVKAIQNIQKKVQNGEAPGPAMIDGLFLFVGGVFLILPGFLSDIIGLLFILPTRKLMQPIFYKWLRKKAQSNQVVIIHR